MVERKGANEEPRGTVVDSSDLPGYLEHRESEGELLASRSIKLLGQLAWRARQSGHGDRFDAALRDLAAPVIRLAELGARAHGLAFRGARPEARDAWMATLDRLFGGAGFAKAMRSLPAASRAQARAALGEDFQGVLDGVRALVAAPLREKLFKGHPAAADDEDFKAFDELLASLVHPSIDDSAKEMRLVLRALTRAPVALVDHQRAMDDLVARANAAALAHARL